MIASTHRTSDCHAVVVDHVALQQVLEDAWGTPHLVQVFHNIATAGLQVGDKRRLWGDGNDDVA